MDFITEWQFPFFSLQALGHARGQLAVMLFVGKSTVEGGNRDQMFYRVPSAQVTCITQNLQPLLGI